MHHVAPDDEGERDRRRRWVRRLDDLGADERERAGGKAAGLARLIDADLPVPEGFAVLAGAYRRFVDAHGLQGEIDAALRASDAQDSDAVEAATALQRRLAGLGPPDDVADEIRAAYAELGAGAVAVRSSSTEEDLAGASFAGQYETLLNVAGADEAVRAVVACWASAWNPRVLAYRRRHGLSSEVDHAVVVQRQLDARSAGVAFTADPLTGRRDRVRVEGTWGLGAPLVAGEVTPDAWVLDPADRRVVHRRVADKPTMTVAHAPGSTPATVDAPAPAEPSLSDAEVADLAGLAVRAQEALGGPLDLEWVADDAGLWLVQARPITSLFPLPEPVPSPDEGLRIYLSFNRVTQGIVEPLTPMGREVWRLWFAGLGRLAIGWRATLHPQVFTEAAGRIYLDVTEVLRRPRLAARFLEAPAEKDPLAGHALARLTEREADALAAVPPGRFRVPWRLVGGLVRDALTGLARPDHAAQRFVTAADDTIAWLEAEAARTHGIEDRLALLERARVPVMGFVVRQMGYLLAGNACVRAADARIARDVGEEAAFTAVHHALAGNPTTEMGLAIAEAAQRIRNEGAEASAAHPAVAEFLSRYGHRTAREIDVGVPRWRETPEVIVDWIAEAMAEPALTERLEADRRALAQGDARAFEIAAQAGGPLRRGVTRWLLRRARTFLALRERPKFDEVRAVDAYRRVLLDLGGELVDRRQLAAADDVMYVAFADIRSDRDLRAVAEENRATHDRELARTSIPRVMTSTGEAIYAVAADDATPAAEGDGGADHSLVGVPASPGQAEGVVRVVANPRAGAIDRGDVLVTRSTDPAWTPLLLRAGAVVMETGGPLMHGAIVAREHGIPAVAGLEHVTERLADGQRVRVDGEAGTVTLLDAAAAPGTPP